MTINEENGICNKMKSLISSLTDSAIMMRDALIHRRCDDVWYIIGQKHRQVAELEQYLTLWQDLYGDINEKKNSPIEEDRSEIRESLVALKRLERSNATLSQTYLSAIRKALGTVGAGFSTKKNVYTKRGTYGKNTSSLLVKQYG